MPGLAAFRTRVGQAETGPWFLLFVVLVFCGEALGYAACALAGVSPPGALAWLASAAVALVVGGVATVLLDWLLLDAHRSMKQEVAALQDQAATRQALELALATRSEQQRRLRHDIRGVLSPILLTADRLLNHADPAIKRSGTIMVRTVERATALLADSAEAETNPPGDP